MDCALFFYNSNETCSQLKPGEKYSKNDNRPMNTSTKYGTKEHMAKSPKKAINVKLCFKNGIQ